MLVFFIFLLFHQAFRIFSSLKLGLIITNKKIKSNTSDLKCDLKENKKKLELPHDAEGNLELFVTT